MTRHPPRSTHSDTLFPDTTLFRSSPQPGVVIDTGRISGYKDEDASANFVKTRMLVAGLAGLGRLSDADVERLAPDIVYRPGYTSRWTKAIDQRSEEHTSELQSLMRISYAVFCLQKKKKYKQQNKY